MASVVVALHSNEFGKLAGALLIIAVVGLSSETIQVGTGVLVQMAWALFGLLIFLLQPIARLCHIEGHVVVAAAPWLLLGVLLSVAKLVYVI